jgi:hypothetical protein
MQLLATMLRTPFDAIPQRPTDQSLGPRRRIEKQIETRGSSSDVL